jgi:hypothetical protein
MFITKPVYPKVHNHSYASATHDSVLPVSVATINTTDVDSMICDDAKWITDEQELHLADMEYDATLPYTPCTTVMSDDVLPF